MVEEKICILGYDALEIELVEKFDFPNLKQEEYGKTDISDFEKIETKILWSSFITGKNLEPAFTKEEGSFLLQKTIVPIYNFIKAYISPKLAISIKRGVGKSGVRKVEGKGRSGVIENQGLKTIFDLIENSIGIDIPGYNHEKQHKYSLQDKLEGRVSASEYWDDIWNCFEETKNILLNNLDKNLVMAWFWPADRVGHIWWDDIEKMRLTYSILNDLAGEVRDKFDGQVFIIADHGMEALGRFGDHSNLNYGYYSSNRNLGLKNPKITDFYDIVKSILEGEFDSSKYAGGYIEEREKEGFGGDDKEEIKKRLRDLGYFD